MTPKEKAIELIGKFENLEPVENYECSFIDKPMAKRCALISVNEILTELRQIRKPEYTTFIQLTLLSSETGDGHKKIAYWQQVKEEINSLI